MNELIRVWDWSPWWGKTFLILGFLSTWMHIAVYITIWKWYFEEKKRIEKELGIKI